MASQQDEAKMGPAAELTMPPTTTVKTPWTTPRRLLLKVDVLLMLLTTLAFGLQYYDKAILSSASLFGILDDLHLRTTLPDGKSSLVRFSTATIMFYIGYLTAALPLSIIVQRVRLNLFLGAAIILWGGIVILTPVVQTYHGLVAQRFFLGAVESAVSPGFVLITRMWYLREEHPVRLGIWFSANGLFSTFSGLVNYSIAKAASKPSSSIAPWKAMYLFAGALTISFGIVCLLLLPPSPQRDAIVKIRGFNAFTPQEKVQLARRTRIDHALVEEVNPSTPDEDVKHKEDVDECSTSTITDSVASAHQRPWSKAQAIEALRDYKTYIYFLQASALYLTNGGVTSFGSLLLKSFGYSSLRSIILQKPGGVVTMVGIYSTTYLARKTRGTLHLLLALSCIPTMVGTLLIWKSDWSHRGAPLAGYWCLFFFGAPFVLVMASATANVRGSTKQSASSAAIFLGYNVGNIVSPYLVKAPQAPQHYRDCFIAIIVGMCITMSLSAVLYFGMRAENKARDRQQSQDQTAESSAQVALDDLTDWQDRGFRYTL